jgi:hypothetical protein
MAEGVEGLTRDKTCKPGKPPPTGTVQRVVNLALGPLPGGTTHWTGRMLAKAAGVSLRSEGPGWESNPRHRRQLCDPQASEGPPMVGPASSLDVPLHPTSVEGFFAKLTRRRLKRGVFRSVVDLQVAINHFVTETNADPKPFVWTADPKRVSNVGSKRYTGTLARSHRAAQRSSVPFGRDFKTAEHDCVAGPDYPAIPGRTECRLNDFRRR